MWYEIIPPLIIVGLVPIVPQYISYYLNSFVFGNPMRRNMCDIWDRHMYTRDWRTDGAPWKNKGLANVPDD